MTDKIEDMFFFILMSFTFPILGVTFGALSGMTVGFFFEETIIGVLSGLGFDMSGITMWQLGATLGFVGSFLSTTVVKK